MIIAVRILFGSWMLNDLYELITGNRPAFDPIGIINEAAGDFTGYELPNRFEAAWGLMQGETVDFKTEKTGTVQGVKNLLANVAETMPFTGALSVFGVGDKLGVDLGSTRVPLESAIPNVGDIAGALDDPNYSKEKKGQVARKDLSKPAAYLLMPFGGGQLKKTVEGVEAAAKGGSYTVDKDGNDILQYPIYQDSGIETAVGAAQAAVFGKTSTEGGRDWVESGFENLNAKETAAYQAMRETDTVTDREAYALLKELKHAEETETEKKNEVKREILRNSDVDWEGKRIAFYYTMAEDKDKEAMDAAAGESPEAITKAMLDMKDGKYSERKYAIAWSGLSDEGKLGMLEIYDEDNYPKYKIGYENGVELDTYAKFQSLKPQFHEGEGGISQEETKELLDSMDVPKEQKAVMWQTCGKNWAPKNNPYSTKVGEKVYKAMNESGDETMKVYLPRPGEVMRTMLPKV